MEVVGRHALLFDDDPTSAFVNSKEALVEWNSLLIDRYDVRHLLHSLPPLSKTRRQSPNEESELDQFRYEDLPPPDQSQSESQDNGGAKAENAGTYQAVAFSYGNIDVASVPKNDEEAGFLPRFPVPEYLIQNLPPTEKLHQIMARTALFVCDHGGQSEIVLRVKQGKNPTFGFLMPDHNLHAYFRFLVDHPEILKLDNDAKPEEHEVGQEQKQTDVGGEALSLLGATYDSGEEEDVAVPVSKESNGVFTAVNGTIDNGSELSAVKNPNPTDNEKTTFSKKTRAVNAIASSTSHSKKKERNMIDALSRQSSNSPSVSMTSSLILEPPSEMKRTMDKIVEFILRNGKDFEAVLIEQDRTNKRFPFLLPSNLYHLYYLKLLHSAQKSKEAGKSSTHDKRSSQFRDSDTLSNGSDDLPFDMEKKEKFKMVIAGLKKDVQEPAPKTTQQFGMSVDAAAAILQAATRGLRIPKPENPKNTSLVDPAQGISSEGAPSSSFGTALFSSQVPSSKHLSKDDSSELNLLELSRSAVLSKDGGRISDVSVAKAIAETAALAAASEADSSEACLTKEQKQKADRLKRAKMFAAIIKSGAAPKASELLPRLSAEPPDSVLSGVTGSGCKTKTKDGSLQVLGSPNVLDVGVVDIIGREREGSSAPVDVDTLHREVKDRKLNSDSDDRRERISKRRHHLRPTRVEEDSDEQERNSEDDRRERSTKKRHHSRSRRVDDDDDDEDRNHRHSRRKHHSHYSSHSSKDEDSRRKRRSSSKERESRHRHKHYSSSEDEERHRSRHYKRRISHSESKVESEDENVKLLESNTARPSKSFSREASKDLVNDRLVGSVPLTEAQSGAATEVPDDLRAKVRAMLLATM